MKEFKIVNGYVKKVEYEVERETERIHQLEKKKEHDRLKDERIQKAFEMMMSKVEKTLNTKNYCSYEIMIYVSDFNSIPELEISEINTAYEMVAKVLEECNYRVDKRGLYEYCNSWKVRSGRWGNFSFSLPSLLGEV